MAPTLETERLRLRPWRGDDLDAFAAFMADGYLWHQVADYTMDSYMIRYRNQKT